MEAKLIQEGKLLDYTATAAVTGGDMVQLPDGRAGFAPRDIAAGKQDAVQVTGIVECNKTTDIALLHGGDAYFDISAGKIHFRGEAGTNDFLCGTIHGDYAAAATTCKVVLNERGRYAIDLAGEGHDWYAEELAAGVAGSVNAYPGGGAQIVLAATAEVEANAIRSGRTILGSGKPIAEFRVNNVAMTDAAVDFDFGLASGTHASDFESVTAFAAFHHDGDDDNIDTHSDDNTTDRALADSTIDHVNGTFAEYWIDGRDSTDVKFYVNGVLVDTSAAKRTLLLTQAYAVVAELEKTTGTATGEVVISRARCRTQSE